MKQEEPAGLIWERLLQQGVHPQPALNRAQIVATALQLADHEGLSAITMRRIASALDSAPMSLYRHIFRKEDLLDLMLDAVFGEIDLPAEPSDDWRADLRMTAQATRLMLKRHPWVMTLLTDRPTIGPNYLQWFDRSLAFMAPLGLDIATMTKMVNVLHGYVIGVVTYEVAEEENTRRTNVSEADKRTYATTSSYVQQIIASGRYPYFARFFNEGIIPDPERDFAFGLDCLLVGLAAGLPPAGVKQSQ